MIKQYKEFKLQNCGYYLLKNQREYPISSIAIFFYDAFPHIRLFGTKWFVDQFKTKKQVGMSADMIELTFDYQNNLAYINELFEESQHEITPELDALLESQDTIELCRRNLVRYIVMTQDNLFHLLLTWDGFVDKKVPYFLIYIDDKDWYDSVAFDTQEAMEQFVADHTKQEAM